MKISSIKLFSIAIVAIIAMACISSAFGQVATGTSQYHRPPPTPRHCNPQHRDWVPTNLAMFKGLPDSDVTNERPLRFWNHDVDILVELDASPVNWYQTQKFDYQQENTWSQADCAFSFLEFSPRVKSDGSYAFVVQRILSKPIVNSGMFQGYDSYWATLPSFDTYLVATSDNVNLATGPSNVFSGYYYPGTEDLIASESIDIQIAHEKRTYSLMAYYPNQPEIWVYFNDLVVVPNAYLQMARDAFYAGEIPMQNDPLAIASGVPEFPCLLWDFPQISARDAVVNGFNATNFVAKYKGQEKSFVARYKAAQAAALAK